MEVVLDDHGMTAEPTECRRLRAASQRNHELNGKIRTRVGETAEDVLLPILERSHRGIDKRCSAERFKRKRTRFTNSGVMERADEMNMCRQLPSRKIKTHATL